MTRQRRERHGFVMLTTLWVLSVGSVIAMGAALVGRHAVSEGATRVELERARWTALGCERRAEAAIDSVLAGATSLDDGALRWRILQWLVPRSPLIAACQISLEAAGTMVDINTVSPEMMVNALTAVGLGDQASALADALVDWRDADDDPLPSGAESSWYASMGRLRPRNGPLADIAELRRVRGFENLGGLDSIVSVAPGRVSLATAPVSVLMAVPGITRETAEKIVELQDAGTPLNDLLSVVGLISETSAGALAARYPDAVHATTPDPDAWVVSARVRRGLPAVSVLLQWRMIRTGHRCVVASTRSIL